MFVAKNVERIERRIGTAKKKVRELRFAVSVEAHDLAIEHASATFQIVSQSFAQTRKALECVSFSRDERTPSALEKRSDRKPSHLISNSQSGCEKGALARASDNGWNNGKGTESSIAANPRSAIDTGAGAMF
jgi:hypothetical protein